MSSNIAALTLIVVGAVTIFGTIWWSGRQSDVVSTVQAGPYYAIVTDDPDILNEGARVYQTACASCHGINFEGQENWRRPGEDGLLPAPPHDPSGHTWHHADFILFNVVKFGPGYNVEGYRSRMRAYEELLTDSEIRAVNSYIAAQWPENVQNRQRAINAQWEAANAEALKR